MKKHGILLLVLGLMLQAILASSAIAQNAGGSDTQPFIRVKKEDAPNIVHVYACYLQKMYTQIGIQDMEGKLWFSEYLSGETGYAKKLDLYGMPDGQYVFFVKNRSGQQTVACSMSSGTPAFYEEVNTPPVAENTPAYSNGVHAESGVFSRDKALEVKFPVVKNQKVTLRVVSLGGSVAWENAIKAGDGLGKKINLSGLSSGSYFLYLKSRDLALLQNLFFDGKTIRLEKSFRLDSGAYSKKPGLAAN